MQIRITEVFTDKGVSFSYISAHSLTHRHKYQSREMNSDDYYLIVSPYVDFASCPCETLMAEESLVALDLCRL